MRRFLSLLILALVVFSTPAFATQYINTANANTNISIGNNNELFVDNVNDRVGIGTTTPAQKLEIDDATSAAIRLGQTGVRVWDIQATGGNLVVNAGSAGGNLSLLTNGNGNVGIGTSTPAVKFETASTSSGLIWNGMFRNDYNANTIDYGVGLKLKISSDSGTEANKWVGIGAIAGSTYANRADMIFYVNPTAGSAPVEKMRITGDGNVGIGTTSPNGKLQINITARATAFDAANGATWHDIIINNPTSTLSAATGIAFEVSGSPYHVNAGTGIAAVKTTAGSDYGTDLVFITRPQSAGAAERMRIDSTGNVGIGTTAPSTQAEIQRYETSVRTTYSDILTIDAKANTLPYNGHGGGILFRGSNYQNNDANVNYARIGSTIYSNSVSTNGSDLFFDVAATSNGVLSRAMTIMYNGSVGIATASPSYKLEVNGDAKVGTTLYVGSNMVLSGTTINYVQALQNAGGTWASYNGGTGAVALAAGGSNQNIVLTPSGSGYTLLNGNVGIGTTAPDVAKLQILAAGSGITQQQSLGDHFYSMGFTEHDAYLTYYTAAGMTIGYGEVTGGAPSVNTLRLLNNGNVGIGTTSPNSTLHVVGTANITSTLYAGSTITGANGLTIQSGTVSLPSGQIDNAELANSAVTVTAGNGLVNGGSVSLGGSTTLNVGAGTCITANADDMAVTADCIGDTQLAYNTGQHLTTSSAPTFAGLTLSGSLYGKGSGSDARVFSNLGVYSSNGATGVIVIQTNVPQDDHTMTTTKVTVHGQYSDGTKNNCDLVISGYWSSEANGGFSGRGMTNVCGDKMRVRFMREIASGKVAVVLGETTTVWSYPKVAVTEWLAGYGITDSYADGWAISVTNDISGYNNSDDVPDTTNIPATQISGTLTDAQIPDTITINQAANADTTDSVHISPSSGYVARFTSATNLGTGVIRDDGTNVGIGVAPTLKLQVNGDVSVPASSSYYLRGTDVNWRLGSDITADSGGMITDAAVQMIVGESGTSYGFQILGHANPTVPVFEVSGTGNVRIKGNLGVGTISPSTAKIVSVGGTYGASTSDRNYILSTGPLPGLHVAASNNYAGDGGTILLGGSAGPTGYIRSFATNNNAGEVIIGNRRSSNADTMYAGIVLDTSGNVGIGDTSPKTKLEVNGGLPTSIPTYANTANGITVSDGGDIYARLGVANLAAGGNGYPTYLQAGDWSGATYYNLLLNPLGGNVGIGTTTPAYKLQVVGPAADWTIHASGTAYGLIGTGTTYGVYSQGPIYGTTTLQTAGAITGSSFSGAGTGLTGTASSLTAGAAITSRELYAKYPYAGSGWITDATTAATLAEINGGTTSVAMHQSHGLFSNWATTLTMSGYDRYGAYQISGNYNANPGALAFRNYNQALADWTPWTLVISSANIASQTVATASNNVLKTGDTMSGRLTWGTNNPNPAISVRHIDGKAPTTDTGDTLYLQYSNAGYGVMIGDSGTDHPLTVYGTVTASALSTDTINQNSGTARIALGTNVVITVG